MGNNPLKAGSLILENIAMFNEAAILLEQQVQTKIFEEFQNIVQKWMIENDCDGKMEWVGEENLWFSPKKWELTSDERNFSPAIFWFHYEEKGTTDSYYIADLCGCGQTRLGFYFEKNDSIKSPVWRSACVPADALRELELFGFTKYSTAGGRWFLPITLENGKLASAYENDDYDEVMEPLRQGLDAIHNALPIFDEIINNLPKDL
jgi:hypothetical protein